MTGVIYTLNPQHIIYQSFTRIKIKLLADLLTIL